jgi:hypothetical protein
MRSVATLAQCRHGACEQCWHVYNMHAALKDMIRYGSANMNILCMHAALHWGCSTQNESDSCHSCVHWLCPFTWSTMLNIRHMYGMKIQLDLRKPIKLSCSSRRWSCSVHPSSRQTSQVTRPRPCQPPDGRIRRLSEPSNATRCCHVYTPTTPASQSDSKYRQLHAVSEQSHSRTLPQPRIAF